MVCYYSGGGRARVETILTVIFILLDISCHASSQVKGKASQVNARQNKSRHVKLRYVKSSQVKSSQVKSRNAKSNSSGGNCTENRRIDEVMIDSHHASRSRNGNGNRNPSPQKQQQQQQQKKKKKKKTGPSNRQSLSFSSSMMIMIMMTGRVIELMIEIVKSPYKKNCFLKVNEDCFEKLKVMMEPIRDYGYDVDVDVDVDDDDGGDDPSNHNQMMNL